MEADLDAVMMRFKGMGQPRQKAASPPPPASPGPHAAQPSLKQTEDSKAATASGDGKQPHQQQQERKLPAAASKRVDAPPKPATQPPKAAAPTAASPAVAPPDGNERSQTSGESSEAGAAPGQSLTSDRSRGAGAVAPPAAKGKQPFKGFGPSPEEIKAALAAGEAAAASPVRGAAGGGASSKGHASSEGSPKKPAQSLTTIRIFLYSLDEAGATQAIADARLEGQVLLEADVKKCVAVVSAKQGRNGKRVQSVQGERMAANAGIPFLCVGRKMNGVNLREALLPLLSPGSRHAQLAKQQALEQSLMREKAGAAVRAAKVTGFFTLPVASPASAAPPDPDTTSSAGAATAPAAASSQLPQSSSSTGPRQSLPRISVPVEEEDDDDMDLLLDGLHHGDNSDEEEEEEEEAELLVRAPAARTAVRRMTMGSRARSPLKLR